MPPLARALLPTAAALSLLPATPSAVMWVLGEEGQSCAEACVPGCSEGEALYASTLEAFRTIAEQLNAPCDRVVEGGAREGGASYDPSVSDRSCRVYTHSEGPPHGAAAKAQSFCELKPPPKTARICPCLGEPFPEEYDCDAGFPRWQLGWSRSKKQWCCANHGKGCPELIWVNGTMDLEVSDTGLLQEHLDTLRDAIAKVAGVQNRSVTATLRGRTGDRDRAPAPRLRRLAEEAKRHWSSALLEYGISYLSNATRVPDVSHTEPREWTELFEKELGPYRVALRVDSASSSPAPEGETPPYDCLPEQAGDKLGWSDSKRAWCCETAGVGCASPEPIFNCIINETNHQESWSMLQQEWCCSRKFIGCKAGQEVGTSEGSRLLEQLVCAVFSVGLVGFLVICYRIWGGEQRAPPLPLGTSSRSLLRAEGKLRREQAWEAEQRLQEEARLAREEEEEAAAEAARLAQEAEEAECKRRQQEEEEEAERRRKREEEEAAEQARRAKAAEEEKAKKKSCLPSCAPACACSSRGPMVSEPQPSPRR